MNAQSQQPGKKPRARVAASPITRLQMWLNENGFTSAELEEVTRICRQTMTKIRAGGDVRKKTMIRIARGAGVLAGRPVRMDELFDLDPFSPENLQLVPTA